MAKTFQVAALPVRKRRDGSPQILLVTSRDTGRWVIPKGWPWAGHSNGEAAAREAWEEAGVVGEIKPEPIGKFKYEKRLRSGKVAVKVDVFRLDVQRAAQAWPEMQQRTRRWFRPEDAADLVQEPELSEMIRSVTV